MSNPIAHNGNVNGQSLTAKSLWGKVVLYLKEQKLISLYIACGDIMEVSLNENKFVIKTEEQLIYSILMSPENFKFLKQAFDWVNFKGEIEVIKIESQEEKIEKDIKKLKDLNLDLTIIEDNQK